MAGWVSKLPAGLCRCMLLLWLSKLRPQSEASGQRCLLQQLASDCGRLCPPDGCSYLVSLHGFVRADLRSLLQCSYQASVPGFVKAGFSTTEAEELMRRSVRLAVEIRDEFWAEHQQMQAASHEGDSSPLERAVSESCSPYRHACAVLHAATSRKADYHCSYVSYYFQRLQLAGFKAQPWLESQS